VFEFGLNVIDQMPFICFRIFEISGDPMPKRDRNGQAEIWTPEQFTCILAELRPQRMQALFGICYYCGCRISEARQLKAEDLVGGRIVFRRATTKTKRTRAVPIHPNLQALLARADLPAKGYLFPGQTGDRPITRQAADKALKEACDRLGYEGYSTHSFRRTWATTLDRNGKRQKVIQHLGDGPVWQRCSDTWRWMRWRGRMRSPVYRSGV
jgi:integrase/recombinase XerD